MVWNVKSIKKMLEGLSSQGYRLTKSTKNIYRSSIPTKLSKWMDTINGHSGGWFHRVKHGHDFSANIGKVYKKFGAKGVLKYPGELLKDASTPHGVPLPGTQFLVESNLVSPKTATKWLSMNLADIFVGGLALYSTYNLYKKRKNGKLDRSSVIRASIGVGVKISAGILTTNPVLILSGVVDIPILISNSDQAKRAFKKFLNYVFSDKAVAGYSGVAAGLGSVVAIKSGVVAFGTASTGTAISTLGGAALTNATLAAIGGGSLASGGLGILGGTIILSGGSALLGLAAGCVVYKLLKK